MDAFKAMEIERMRLGGNAAWRDFFESHEETKMLGTSWDDATIADRYGGDVGGEYKERLSAKVEGREYEPGEAAAAAPKKTTAAAAAAPTKTASPAPSALSKNLSRTGTPSGAGSAAAAPVSGSRTASPTPSGLSGSGGGKVKVDDRYFARLGADNASRPDSLPPSQGGKYAGFGNTPGPAAGTREGAAGQQLPGFDDLQKDPVAALTKGFGWFATTLGRTAKQVNDDYIQPTAKNVSSLCLL